MIQKYKSRFCIEIMLAFYWCAFLLQTDSYYVPYLLVGIAGICCYVVRMVNEKDRNAYAASREKRLTLIYSAVLAMAVVLANYRYFDGISEGKYVTLRKLVSAVLVLGGGVVLFREILIRLSKTDFQSNKIHLKNKHLFWGILWTIMVVTNAIVLFGSQYPGELTPDSLSQMSQLLTHTYSNHHPYYHTQIIHVLIWIGYALFGEINSAVATYSVFSIIVMASCFLYVTKTVYECTENYKIATVVFIGYLIMPFHIMYSITMWKDVFFGAAVTFFVVACYRIVSSIGNHKANYMIAFAAAIGMCLLRSNGLVAFFLSAIAFMVLFGKKEKKMLIMFAAVLLASFILKHPVLNLLQVTQPDLIESLSIPAQQVARVVADGEELTAEQRAVLSEVVDIEKIPETYSSVISDPIKKLVREKNNQNYIEEHTGEFLKVYLQLGLRYPYKYVEAWIDQTRGYWNAGYSYWRWASDVDENNLGIKRTVFSEGIDNIVGKYLGLWDTSPFLQLFLCIGVYVWIIAALSYRAVVRKNKKALFTTIPFLAIILTLMVATPVFAEFRYAYAIFCGFPFVVVAAFASCREKENVEL